jgi:glycine betaine catabolism A
VTEALDERALASALDRTTLPAADATTLPAAVYTSAAIHTLECRELFARGWLAVAREDDFPAPGRFITTEIGSERILIVRADADRLHAFFNVCRHRGARLVTEPSGSLRGAIACPYHAWTYGFDGRLERAPRMQPVQDSGTIALACMPLARVEGFVWINLDGEAPPLDASPGVLPDLRAFGLTSLRRAGRLDYELACNWKIVCENYSECYHCPGVHPQLSRLSDVSSGGFDAGAHYNGGPMQLRPGAQTLSMTGRSDWPRLANDVRAADLVHYYLVYPNLMLGIHPDYLLTHRVWPLAPSRSRVECELFVVPEALAAADFDPAGVLQFWDITNRQDWALCERVQQGAGSRGYRPGPYHPSERCVHAFDCWYAKWLRERMDGAAPTLAHGR